jgi:bacillolysin
MKKITFFLLFTFVTVSLYAQSKHVDPRILKGFDASKIPTLKSWTDLKAPTGGQLQGAVQIGKAEYVWTDAGKPQDIMHEKNSSGNDATLWRILRSANGTANWMWRISSKSKKSNIQSININDGIQVLQEVKTTLHITDPKSEFYQMSATTDELGDQHLRYGQQYNGVPVWNRDLYIHLDASGEPYIINGTYEPTPKNIITTPSISNPYSIILAIADLKTQGKWAPISSDVAQVLGSSEPTAKLVLYPNSGVLQLAYEVNITANLLESYLYLIDATTGDILTKINRSCSVVPVDPKAAPITAGHFVGANNNPPLQPQSGFTDASGIDLNGVTQSIRTYQHTDGKYYAIWDLPSFNAGASTLPDQPSGGAITLTLNNQDYTQNASLFHNTSSDNTWSDPVVVSAHHNMLVTYNYYSNTFQRKAIDNNNGLITSIIHVTQNGAGMDNAFWSFAGKVMIYGDGNVEFKPLAGGIDVAGHEMTHGVISSTCDLVYQFQSGALNESLADVFGIMVDTRTLTVGKDIMLPGKGTCLRDLADPHNPSGLSHQPAQMSEYVNDDANTDNGGVHTNSGIPNRACAILVTQLGRDKVQKMYYRAMTVYLTRSSQFTDERIAVQSAAKDLFGATSAEFNAVGPAFDSVGITGPGSNPNQNDIPSQTGGTPYIGFTNVLGDIGLYDPATNKYTVPGTAGLIARVSDNGSSRAQLTAPRNGGHGYYVDPSGHLSFVEVASGNVFSYPNLHIQSDGDLWNASVSPDESAVALTSAYYNDPNIYIFDGTNIFTLPLRPVSTDGGADSSIDYPDVVSWSPNKSVPRIGFDAFLSNKLGIDSLSYWSMYEVDYNSKNTYNLFPAQTSAIDIGNIAYSNTSPDVITFNSIVKGNDWDVWVADFKNNNIGYLGVDKRTINGNPVLDAQKPSFSPDDQTLVFASPSNKSLLFYQLSSQALTFVPFPAAVYQPYWFLLGGSAGVYNTKTNATNNLSVYPSSFSENSTIAFSLNSAEEITVDLLNIFGQTVRTILKERMNEGTHEIKFSVNGLSSGTYFTRLLTKNGQSIIKVVIEK